MDSIKKKMEKLANETQDAEARIAHFEAVKAANEAEAEKYEEQGNLLLLDTSNLYELARLDIVDLHRFISVTN